MYTIAQIVGILAVATFLLSYQLKKRKNIILVNAASSFLYVLQYILLGALEGAAIDVLSTVSTVAAHNKGKRFLDKYAGLILLLLNLSILAAGLALYKNIFSLFPVVGAILQTSAFWITDEKRIRQVSFLGTPFWLTYNLVSQAYGAAVGSFLSMVSIGLAIYRYDIYPKRKAAASPEAVAEQ
jgi:hypothetical protein